MFRTDDPVDDFNRHSAEEERQMAKLLKCIYCRHPITDDTYYDINDECVCEDCLNEHHRKWVDDYVE